MLFEISNPKVPGLTSHCGVREFSTREGLVYLPHWLMENLALNPGDMIQIANVSLPKGTFVQLQPHKNTFVQLSNPKAILERALRQFTCLSKGTTIAIPHGDFGTFKLDVVDVKPSDAVSIVETDVNVDFLPPKDEGDSVSSSYGQSNGRGAPRSSSSGGSGDGGDGAASSQLTSATDKAQVAAAMRFSDHLGDVSEEKNLLIMLLLHLQDRHILTKTWEGHSLSGYNIFFRSLPKSSVLTWLQNHHAHLIGHQRSDSSSSSN
eukprot:TRINITY_DN14747_c0_g1_i2.p1 TRINITY_DN14747_c0_g1~~TRINITY_DN14747_c0_g1_i2.p1  ORF type:complete len:263 (-),score=45.55 TRINITY_DN14747_c0_g1_i2:142-930(-)